LTIGWPALSKRLRKLSRKELRLSSPLWKEYKRNRKLNRSSSINNAYAMYLVFPGLLVAASFQAGSEVRVLLAIALYATGTSLYRAKLFKERMLNSGERTIFAYLPVSDDNYYRFQLRRYLLGWLWAGALFLLAYEVLAFRTGNFSHHLWIVLLAAVIQTVSSLTISVLVLRYVPRVLLVKVLGPFYLLILAVNSLSTTALSYIALPAAILPGGWPVLAFEKGIGGDLRALMLLSIPSVALAAFLPAALSKLRQRYVSELSAADKSSDTLSNEVTDDNEHLDLQPDIRDGHLVQGSLYPMLAIRQIEKREFLQGVDWESTGWIENLWKRTLNPREEVIAEFLTAGIPGYWLPFWLKALWITCGGIVLNVIPGLPTWILFVPLAIATAMMVPVFGGSWRGFAPGISSGYLVPMYAAFPIRYLELTRVMLKANLIRIATWLPIFCAGVVAIAVHFAETPMHGLQVALQIGLMVVLLQLPMIAGRCAAGSNINRNMNLHTLMFCFAALVLTCALIASVVTFFVSETDLKFYMPVITLVSGFLFWAMYGWLQNRGRLDLLSAPSNLQ
jgi:hypothetical protein